MTPSSGNLLATVLIRALQFACIILILVGLSSYNAMVEAIASFNQGAISLPELCWKILPVTGPLIPGLGLIVGCQLLLRKMSSSIKDAKEPWLANSMWAAKHIRLSNRGLYLTLAVGWLIFVGIVIPFSIATAKTPFLVMSGVFGLVLLLITRVIWLNRKWNTAELRMATVPGVVGGPFSGVAILQQEFPAGTAFEVCLKCEQTKTYTPTQGSGKTSNTTETVWSSTNSIDKPLPADAPNRTLIPFGFAIPFGCEPTSTSNNTIKTITRWRLVVNQKDKVGFGGSVFTVPVFVTPESRPDFELDTGFFATYEQEVDLDSVLKRVQLKSEQLAGSAKRLTFSFWDVQGIYAIALLSLICTSIIVAFFWFVPNIYGAIFASIFPGVLLFAGWYMLLDMLLWGSSIEFGRNTLTCISGWRGMRQTLEIDQPALAQVRTVLDFRKEHGESYRVEIHLPERERDGVLVSASDLTIVKQLKGRAEAEAVAQWLKNQIES